MDKLTVLIVDDEGIGLNIIRLYLLLYFTDLSMLEIEAETMAKLAIKKINKRKQPYDLVLVDLDFESDEDKDEQGKKLNGNDIIIAAARKNPNSHTRYFTVSGKKNLSRIQGLEQEITDKGIKFTALFKDEASDEDLIDLRNGIINENVKKLRAKIDKELLQWTEYNFQLGITQTDKNKFLSAIELFDLKNEMIVFGQRRTLKVLLIYWINKGEKVTPDTVLASFPYSFFDLPKIKHKKLFTIFGLQRVKYPLVNYYQQFYSSPIDDLPELLSITKGYLNLLAEVYNICHDIYDDSIKDSGDQFKARLAELHKQLKNEEVYVHGELDDPSCEKAMIQFKKRLWFRLFCVGAYFLQISTSDIFRLMSPGTLEDVTSKYDLKAFSRSMWLEDFSKKLRPLERNYRTIWNSLTHYERTFLKEWWQELSDRKEDGLKQLFTTRKLDKVSSYIV